MQKRHFVCVVGLLGLVGTLFVSQSAVSNAPLAFTTYKQGETLTPAYVNAWTQKNKTLERYFYPDGPIVDDIKRNYNAFLRGCKASHKCHCAHVAGSMDKDVNPTPKAFANVADSVGASGMRTGKESKSTIKDGKGLVGKKDCSCFINPDASNPCLFSDMKPSKLLVIIALARARGVSHIVEAGRYGGLSAAIYNLHGLGVDSLEYLPLDMVSLGLQLLTPKVVQQTGDDRVLAPDAVLKASASGKRVGIIFDGSKRFQAWGIYQKVKDKVAFAVFDDARASGFGEWLNKWGAETKTPVWWSMEQSYKKLFGKRDEQTLKFKEDVLRGHRFFGGLERLAGYEFAIIPGEAW